jgi:regulator of sigma E protease
MFSGMIASSADKPMAWQVKRGEEIVDLTITPQMSDDGSAKVGIYMSVRYEEFRQPTLAEAARGTWNQITYWTDQIFIGLKKLVMMQVKLQDLGGPVDIARTTGEAAAAGLTTLVLWTAILSLYLGIFNLLPVPALDGSRLIFLGIEAVRGKPISQERESLVHLLGFSALFLLMIAVTYYDIIALFQS